MSDPAISKSNCWVKYPANLRKTVHFDLIYSIYLITREKKNTIANFFTFIFYIIHFHYWWILYGNGENPSEVVQLSCHFFFGLSGMDIVFALQSMSSLEIICRYMFENINNSLYINRKYHIGYHLDHMDSTKLLANNASVFLLMHNNW